MPRKCLSKTSSASIVTLVSSSPIHQPRGSWSPSRWSRALASVAAASWSRSPGPAPSLPATPGTPDAVIPDAGFPAVAWALRRAPSASVPRVGARRTAVVIVLPLLALPLASRDEFGDRQELAARVGRDANTVERGGGGRQAVGGLLLRPGRECRGQGLGGEGGRAGQDVLGQLVLAREQRLQFGGLR